MWCPSRDFFGEFEAEIEILVPGIKYCTGIEYFTFIKKVGEGWAPTRMATAFAQNAALSDGLLLAKFYF